MPQKLDSRTIYYTYILFDWRGTPRYVGKGKGNRWLGHEQSTDPNNPMKNEFIEQTWTVMGEIPKIKVQENLNEGDAFTLEGLLIKAIGRHPNGPLVNLTDKRNGPSSERIRAWHASRTPEERSASARKSIATLGPEGVKRRGQREISDDERNLRAERMTKTLASFTPEQRRANGILGGKAASLVTTLEQKRERAKKMLETYLASTTPEERSENYKRSGIAKLTTEQLSENGKKGVAKANASRTPEERKELASKAVTALHASRTPEQRQEMARRAGLKAAESRTFESYSDAARKRAKTVGKERLSEIGKIAGSAPRRPWGSVKRASKKDPTNETPDE